MYVCDWRKYLCVSLETCWDGSSSPGTLQGRGEFQKQESWADGSGLEQRSGGRSWMDSSRQGDLTCVHHCRKAQGEQPSGWNNTDTLHAVRVLGPGWWSRSGRHGDSRDVLGVPCPCLCLQQHPAALSSCSPQPGMPFPGWQPEELLAMPVTVQP